MNNPTVTEIVAEYLREHGYDGLCANEGECACEIGDLAPCGEMQDDCWAGHKLPCDCGEGHDWHIGKLPDAPQAEEPKGK